MIYYFGKPFSFSHVVALKRFGKNENYRSRHTIEDAINSVKKNSVAVVPIENTYGGIVSDTVNYMVENRHKSKIIEIKEEIEMKIQLYLIGKSKIAKRIYSHAYPLKVSEEWIKKNLPKADIIETSSTSEAVLKARSERNSCAIASKEAADYYRMKISGQIEPSGKQNITRFFIFGLK